MQERFGLSRELRVENSMILLNPWGNSCQDQEKCLCVALLKVSSVLKQSHISVNIRQFIPGRTVILKNSKTFAQGRKQTKEELHL